jgi:hypothetical protein
MSDHKGELILYRTEDGRTDIHLRAADGTAWLTQAEMAELFETSKQNISLHIRNILEEGELSAEATVKDYLTVQKTLAYSVVRRPAVQLTAERADPSTGSMGRQSALLRF